MLGRLSVNMNLCCKKTFSFSLYFVIYILKEGVKIQAGPNLSEALKFGPYLAASMKTEYGSLECAVEIVDDLDAAIKHINENGSSHTDAIVTNNGEWGFFSFCLFFVF